MQRSRVKRRQGEAQSLFRDDRVTVALDVPPARIGPLIPTPVYDTYWRFAAERQQVFFRRLRGEASPWTDDDVLQSYKFTNAYRASDRVSQYLIRRVIYRDDLPQSATEIVFRTLMFKMFNRIDTWELLERSLGAITYETFCVDKFDKVLTRAMKRGERVYSAAYIMPAWPAGGGSRKHRQHLKLLERMMSDDLPARLGDSQSMQRSFDLIRAYPSIGDFLAYQYVTDINYSTVCNHTEMEFVVAGPGAVDGIRKCFADTAGLNDAEVIRFMADRQETEFARLGVDFQNLWGRRLQLIDCQNLFCEVDKYSRVRHPEFNGRSGRSRIKQKFRAKEEAIDYWYPPKWRIEVPLRPDATTGCGRGNSTTIRSKGEIHMDFDAYQKRAGKTDRNPGEAERDVLIPLLGLAGESGELLTEYKKLLRDGEAHTQFRGRFAEELGDLLWYVANVATKLGLNLSDVAAQNLDKCEARWGGMPKRQPFDKGFPDDERFPRRFLIDFATTHEKDGTPVVRVFYEGKPFGNNLTDNAYTHDGYGYHDALHLAFTAVLGWSPLTRKLIGKKRRSNEAIDEVEDGGRAVAIEEGLSAVIFAHARDYNWLEGKGSVSSELLRTIKSMTSHLEVSACTTGEWEKAIIQGFAVWREISRRGAGTLIVDLDERTICLKGK